MLPETRTYVDQTDTTAFDGFTGLRRGLRYTGTVLDDGRVRVAAVGALPGAGVHVSAAE